MRIHRFLLAAVLLTVGQFANTTAAVEFNEIARFNVDFAFTSDLDPEDEIIDDNPKFIGTNPLAVAWNGSKLYLAGFDNFGSSNLDNGLTEVLNATRTGEVVIGDADLANPFGQVAPISGRGYVGLALSGDRLAASYDGGSPTANAIQVFDTADNSLIWDLSASGTTSRGGSGVAFDPGFPGGDPAQGTGVAWTTFASGRRALNNTETGATIHDLSTGMVWIRDPFPPGNFARDMDFDPDTGDVYVRRSNDLDKAVRTGDNATGARTSIVDTGSNGDFVLGHKVEFLSNTVDGDLLIYNDRSSTPPDPFPFVDSVKVIDPNGVAQTATFNLLGGLTGADIADGIGIYDFDFDEASQTLALMDFANRNVFIFKVGPLTGGGLAGDYNDDGVVNAADYTLWRDNLGAADESSLNGNGDGLNGVDQADYDRWVANFGATAGSGTGTAIPEPTSLALFLFAITAISARSVARKREH